MTPILARRWLTDGAPKENGLAPISPGSILARRREAKPAARVQSPALASPVPPAMGPAYWIPHSAGISVAVRDLVIAERSYTAALAPSVRSVWYRVTGRLCCCRVVGVPHGESNIGSGNPLESRRAPMT